MIKFFKTQVLLEMLDDYGDLQEMIKILKENYFLMKDCFETPSGYFREIATKL